MSSIITVGFALEWDYPVIVRNGTTDDRSIHGPREALKYLQKDFTIKSGQPYWRAVGACNAALLYRGDPDGARNSFIAAYAEYVFRVKSQ